MNQEFQDEVEALNSIYGDGTLDVTPEKYVYVVHLPQQDTSLRLQFPSDYPATPPIVLGTQSSGEHTKKGEAAHVLTIFRDVLGRLFQPGQVCLFDIIEEINNSRLIDGAFLPEGGHNLSCSQSSTTVQPDPIAERKLELEYPPPWTLSDVVMELKSVFIARCAPVSSPDQAKVYLRHLLDSDKKIRSATHNITAWRIKGPNNVTFQDCDDDGETAAGGRLLHLMQLMELWNVMVVVTRWYGGHQLGPKRFSIINTVARDAFVKGSFVSDEVQSKKKVKK